MHRGLWRRPRRWRRCKRRQQRWRQERKGDRVGLQDRKEAFVPWSIGTIPAFAWSVCGNHGKPQTGLPVPVPGFEPQTSRITIRRDTRLAKCFGHCILLHLKPVLINVKGYYLLPQLVMWISRELFFGEILREISPKWRILEKYGEISVFLFVLLFLILHRMNTKIST